MERVLNTIISPWLEKQALRSGKRDKKHTEEKVWQGRERGRVSQRMEVEKKDRPGNRKRIGL